VTSPSLRDLKIKAGKTARQVIQDGGFSLDAIRTYCGPATGPRWLAASGFDLSLLKAGVLGRTWPVLLVGASAGAWRFAAWIQPEAEKSYRNLMDAYMEAVYTRKDTPATIRATLERILHAAIDDDAAPFALAHRRYRLAVIAARVRHLAASERRWIQYAGFGLCYAMNALNRSLLRYFAEPVVFYTGPKPPPFTIQPSFPGRQVVLSHINLKPALVATGAIPLVVAGVRDIYGAPRGVYRDGGLTDYHLTRPYGAKDGDLTLLFLHQERIIPGWLDKGLVRRQPPPEALDNVVMAYPSNDLVSRLPGGKIPDRDDFTTFVNDPATRIRHWRQAVQQCSHLGEVFLELVASGRIREAMGRLEE